MASSELLSLALGPDLRVTNYSGCMVNGVKFLNQDRDNYRTTQKRGVRVEGEHNNDIIDFYGVLKEVVELRYRSYRVVLFKFDWFDSRHIQCDKFFISINFKKYWYVNEPYVLTSQATQVFYVLDTKLSGDWYVAQVVHHRHLWDLALFGSDDENVLTKTTSSESTLSINKLNARVLCLELMRRIFHCYIELTWNLRSLMLWNIDHATILKRS